MADPRAQRPDMNAAIMADVQNQSIINGMEMASVANPDMPSIFPQSDVADLLRNFRYNQPYIPVYVPNSMLTLVNPAGALNKQRVSIPTSAKCVTFMSNAIDWTVSFNGAGGDPATEGVSTDGNANIQLPGNFYAPSGLTFFVANINEMSFFLKTGAIVGLLFSIQNDLG